MKLAQLTFTRFLAAIAIIIYHFGLRSFPFDNYFVAAVLQKGFVFVSYFFILSGFVMVIAYGSKAGQKIHPPTYYVNRFARIFPLYLLALIVMTIPHLRHLDITTFVLQLTLLQAWVPPCAMGLNSAGWSLSAEAFFYLLFPLLFNKIYLRYPIKYVFLGIVIVMLVCYLTANFLAGTSYIAGHPNTTRDLFIAFPIFRLSEFLIGNALGLVFLKIPAKYFKNYDIPLLLWSAVIILMLYTFKNVSPPYYIFWPFFSIFIVLLSLNRTGYITKVFSTSKLVLLGEISYGVYILQFPVWTTIDLVDRFVPAFHSIDSFYLRTIILIVVSYICYRLIEVAGRDRIKARYSSWRSRRSVAAAKL